jgi:hypothetical protein
VPLLAALAAGAALVGLLELLPDGPPGQPPCSGSDYGCRLNVNQGALTVIALALAVVTGLVAYRDYASGRRARDLDREREVGRFSSVYFDALYEALHNLFHIACAFADRAGTAVLETWPQYDLRYATRLLEPPNSDYLDPRVRPFVDHMLRNDLYIQRFPDTDAGRAAILRDVGYLAEHALRFLLEAWRCPGGEATEANALFEHLRAQGALRSLTDRERDIKARGFRVRLLRSTAERKPVDPGTVVLWWFDDSDALKATPLFRELRGFDDPPPRPLRPAAPLRVPHIQAPTTSEQMEPTRAPVRQKPEGSRPQPPEPVDRRARGHGPGGRRAAVVGAGLAAAAAGLLGAGLLAWFRAGPGRRGRSAARSRRDRA